MGYTWADERFRDLLRLHVSTLDEETRDRYVSELCAKLQREWFIDPKRASLFEVRLCWDAWLECKGGLDKIQNGE